MTISTAELLQDLERAGGIPLHFQIAERLRSAIQTGNLLPGSRIENEVALAERLGISRPTIRRAIQDLVDQGLLVRRRGVGTQVVMGRVSRNVALSSLHDDLVRDNRSPSTRVLQHDLIGASREVAAHLNIAPDTPILRIRRLRCADGVPFALLVNYLAPEFRTLTPASLEESGLYQLLRDHGATMRVAKQTIGARAATAEESTLFDTKARSPVLTMSRTLYDNSGRAIEYGTHSYLPELYSFEVTLVEK